MSVSDFNVIENKNGNTVVNFLADGKNRNIVFIKGSQAQADFKQIYSSLSIKYNVQDIIADSRTIKESIVYMRKQYIFTVNPNNAQYFYADRKVTNLKVA